MTALQTDPTDFADRRSELLAAGAKVRAARLAEAVAAIGADDAQPVTYWREVAASEADEVAAMVDRLTAHDLNDVRRIVDQECSRLYGGSSLVECGEVMGETLRRVWQHDRPALAALVTSARGQGLARVRMHARSIVTATVKERTFTPDQADAVAAALEADGRVSKYDDETDRTRVRNRLNGAADFAAAMGSPQATARDDQSDGRRKSVDKVRKIAEASSRSMADPMAKGAVRLVKEQSLEVMLRGFDPRRELILDPADVRGDVERDKVERAASVAALRVALTADRLPQGRAGAMAGTIREAVAHLETMTATGLLRRATGLQREASTARADAVRCSAIASAALVGGSVDERAAERMRAKRASLAAREHSTRAEVLDRAALALVGAVAAGRRADRRPLYGPPVPMVRPSPACPAHVWHPPMTVARPLVWRPLSGCQTAAPAWSGGTVALVDLLAALVDTTADDKRDAKRSAREHSRADWSALAAALALPTGDATVKALRQSVRTAVGSPTAILNAADAPADRPALAYGPAAFLAVAERERSRLVPPVRPSARNIVRRDGRPVQGPPAPGSALPPVQGPFYGLHAESHRERVAALAARQSVA